jgi:hypothetical protein
MSRYPLPFYKILAFLLEPHFKDCPLFTKGVIVKLLERYGLKSLNNL